MSTNTVEFCTQSRPYQPKEFGPSGPGPSGGYQKFCLFWWKKTFACTPLLRGPSGMICIYLITAALPHSTLYEALSKTLLNLHGSSHFPALRHTSSSSCRGLSLNFSTDPHGKICFKNHPAKFFVQIRDPNRALSLGIRIAFDWNWFFYVIRNSLIVICAESYNYSNFFLGGKKKSRKESMKERKKKRKA